LHGDLVRVTLYLALKTAEGTHITLLYFNRLRRGYEQESVKSTADEYFRQRDMPHVTLAFGEIREKRSIRVHGEIEQVIEDLKPLFSSYDIDLTQQAHIDLRGVDSQKLSSRVPTMNNWNHWNHLYAKRDA
jgi:hypothetical protein